MKANKGTTVTVTVSGTGTGFVKFRRGQLDVANASRPITVEEQKACEAANVSFVELPVAHDAITIIVNSAKTWASAITVPELRTLWDAAAEKTITTWKQVRADWPDRQITLFGPGTESGTFDYSLGAGPSTERRQRRTRDLSPIRSTVVHLRQCEADRAPEVRAFARYFVRKARELAGDAGSVPMMGMAYTLAEQRLEKMATGTMFKAPNAAELGVEYLLTR